MKLSRAILMIFPESDRTTCTGWLIDRFLVNTGTMYFSSTFNLGCSWKLNLPIYYINIHSITQNTYPAAIVVSSQCKRNCILLIHIKKRTSLQLSLITDRNYYLKVWRIWALIHFLARLWFLMGFQFICTIFYLFQSSNITLMLIFFKESYSQ